MYIWDDFGKNKESGKVGWGDRHFKNPNCPEARLLAIYKCSQEVEPGTATLIKIQGVVRVFLKSEISEPCPLVSRTGGSVGWAPGCHAGGREFNSGRTNTQGL